MAADWEIVQGDTAPVYTDTLTYSDGSAVDLTGATVKWIMRSLVAIEPMRIAGTVQVTTPTTGKVKFSPAAADTVNAGQLMANWAVTFPDGTKMTFPTVGYISVLVHDNLTTVGSQQLVSLPDIKEYLAIPANDRTRDAKLLRAIASVRPVVENITGPILPATREEWHAGGRTFIQVRRPPSTGYGTTPVMRLIGCDEYRGPLKYPLQIVGDPSQATLYSCFADRLGTVTRLSTGGGAINFPDSSTGVHIVYQSGQESVPANVYEGTLELLRVNYETTQPTGRGLQTLADGDDSARPLGFFVPRRVRELLAPNGRAPSIA